MPVFNSRICKVRTWPVKVNTSVEIHLENSRIIVLDDAAAYGC